MGDAADRRAWFVAALCLAWPDGHTETFVGRVDGTATWPPRGDKGFGYDPMFVPCGSGKTFGEIDAAEKHTVSHRARAFAQLLVACLAASPRHHAIGRTRNPDRRLSARLPPLRPWGVIQTGETAHDTELRRGDDRPCRSHARHPPFGSVAS